MANNNKSDGAAGGRFAAGLLSSALCAEASHTTMDEDSAKVDLKLSLRNVFSKGSLVEAHCQVKHGKCFRDKERETPDSGIKLQQILQKTLEGLRHGVSPAFLLWVPASPSNKAYWEFIPKNRKKKTPIYINPLQEITPSLAYDMCRFHGLNNKTAPHSQIILPSASPVLTETHGRREYSKLKKSLFINPIVGEISVTRTAWRHITRPSRSTAARKASIEVISKLENFLTKTPKSCATKRYPKIVHSKSIIENRDLLLRYDNAIRKGNQTFDLLVRVREEIRYPRAWRQFPLSVGSVKQKATLVSWWYKK